MKFTPPRIAPPTRALSLLETLRAARRNVLEIIPGLSYVQPMLSGRLGSRWHMVQDPGAEGDSWRWQRRTVAPVFAPRNVIALAPVMTATAERAAQRLARSGGEAEMVSEMFSATFDVICDVALSGREHFDAQVYGQAIIRYFETVGRASVLDFLHVPNWMPRPGAILGKGSVRTMHAMVARAIEERRRKIAAGATRATDDLLDYMLKAEDAETGRRMTPEELLHNMQFFIVGGHETTALTLSWALLLLAGDAQTQERARAEARAALGNAPAGAEHIALTPYVNQVIEEAMRLYPPVGLLARSVRRPDLLAGREVLPNDTLFMPIFALHRHRMWWDDPDAFDPDNFAPEKTAKRDRYLYLPFGAGPRVCVGANFAMMQAHIILATLLARFRFAPGDGPPPVPTMSMTVRPEGGVRLMVTPL
jgi:cytochrome P450